MKMRSASAGARATAGLAARGSGGGAWAEVSCERPAIEPNASAKNDGSGFRETVHELSSGSSVLRQLAGLQLVRLRNGLPGPGVRLRAALRLPLKAGSREPPAAGRRAAAGQPATAVTDS